MRRIRYTKYTGELADDISLEDLMQQLSDYLLDSGFQNPWMQFSEMNEHNLENLREALRQALEMGDFEQQLRDRIDQMNADGEMEQLIEQLIQRMEQQDYIRIDAPPDPSRMSTTPGSTTEAEGQGQARFEVTDKSLDFLGYKTLRDLLGSLGHASIGRHDTRHQATGVETNGSIRPYEFGDTMNLDANATLAAAITSQAEHWLDEDRDNASQTATNLTGEGRGAAEVGGGFSPRARETEGDGGFSPRANAPDQSGALAPENSNPNGLVTGHDFSRANNADKINGALAPEASSDRATWPHKIWPIEVDYPHLHVQQSDYQSSCATVVMLDCSHSMILYGEDRFTPAKRVAMALSHLIRTQYPGDTLNLVLFHDSAEEVPVSQLARVKVGPHYTNTREGLRMARSILNRQRKEMRQIVMITDGKPSALTLPDGRIYKNAFGLDPLVLSETLEEVARCRRSGILINTFMLASDPGLVQFVQRVSAMCRGKAYFTTPQTLGNYLMMDFLNRKMKTVH